MSSTHYSHEGNFQDQIAGAAELIRQSSYFSAFTGAGISVESGVPPFRGENGLWNTYDPSILELGFFYRNPEESWPVIKEIFYAFFGKARPNAAHYLLAELEEQEILKSLITQNIDALHHRAGSRNVVEYHGNSRNLVCTSCGARYEVSEELLEPDVPRCSCGGVLKPDFIFFGESIPPDALRQSQEVAEHTDCMLLIGTTGEVYPAAMVPQIASRNGATIIEINPNKSLYTDEITDLFIKATAEEAGEALRTALG
jgi:NAD-dependent deacetylase